MKSMSSDIPQNRTESMCTQLERSRVHRRHAHVTEDLFRDDALFIKRMMAERVDT